MRQLQLKKLIWDGNRWPSIDVFPYEYEDFLKVVAHLCTDFDLPFPPISDLLDGYAADLNIDGVGVALHLDNWTFSVAAEREDMRDKLFLSLEQMCV